MSEQDEIPVHRYTAAMSGEIEAYWQDFWEENGTFRAPNPTGPLADPKHPRAGAPKLYVLDMFPYPSGAGLHVGHPLGYIGTDCFGRYNRMAGRNVLHAMGFDAYGLPAEQYAVQTGQHPRKTTEANIVRYRAQLRRLGLAYDPRRSVATIDPEFYRWPQWIFLQIFNSWYDPAVRKARPIAELISAYESSERPTPDGRAWGDLTEVEQRTIVDDHRLAYVSHAPVNWCPALGTVLANEEVTAEGRSERGNHPVFKRALLQWVLAITAYADRLIADLDLVDWPEPIKVMQRNWIGRSVGANGTCSVAGHEGAEIEVFTTRPDTLFGATYMVLAPEHPLVDAIVPSDWPDAFIGDEITDIPPAWRGIFGTDRLPAEAVREYREFASVKSDLERQAEGKVKTGVFTGAFAVNPTNGLHVPIFIADYVMMGYGTGAIMAVPAHDERDFDFAREFDLPITAVVRPPDTWLTERGITADTPANEWPEGYVGDGE